MSTYAPTYVPKGPIRDQQWYLVDAEGKTLGRLATVVASRLRGKHRPTFTPSHDLGSTSIAGVKTASCSTTKYFILVDFWRAS